MPSDPHLIGALVGLHARKYTCQLHSQLVLQHFLQIPLFPQYDQRCRWFMGLSLSFFVAVAGKRACVPQIMIQKTLEMSRSCCALCLRQFTRVLKRRRRWVVLLLVFCMHIAQFLTVVLTSVGEAEDGTQTIIESGTHMIPESEYYVGIRH